MIWLSERSMECNHAFNIFFRTCPVLIYSINCWDIVMRIALKWHGVKNEELATIYTRLQSGNIIYVIFINLYNIFSMFYNIVFITLHDYLLNNDLKNLN